MNHNRMLCMCVRACRVRILCVCVYMCVCAKNLENGKFHTESSLSRDTCPRKAAAIL